MSGRWAPWWSGLLGAAALAAVAARGEAQTGPGCASPGMPAPSCPSPGYVIPYPQYCPGMLTPAPTEGPKTPAPGTPEAKETKEAKEAPAAPGPLTPDALAFNAPAAAAGGGGTTSVTGPGYLDLAVPFTHYRVRFDSAYGNNEPDRAEFFYAKCGCFRNLPPATRDLNAAGPPKPETNVDYQEISNYFEWATSKKFSVFAEVPVRFINPEQNDNAAGLGDVSIGYKYAMIAEPGQWFTFQFRTIAPTGDAGLGLGTHHVSLEPGLVYYAQPNQNWNIFGQIKDWIPVGGTNFAGNVLDYGVGVGYTMYTGCNNQNYILPLLEMMGWTVLNGMELGPDGVAKSARGDTIVNAKFGARFGWGPHQSVYVGYGRALTGDVWYKDILRLEYRYAF